MKKYIIPIILISIILLYENTSAYWIYQFGEWMPLIILIYTILFLCTTGLTLYYIVRCARAKLKDKKCNIITLIMIIVLAISLLTPGGLIPKKALYKGELLVAHIDGVAGYNGWLTLYGNNIYEYNYGINHTEGKYKVQNDTIYFDSPKNENTYTFDYATLQNNKLNLRFGKDSIIGYSHMSIVKNELLEQDISYIRITIKP